MNARYYLKQLEKMDTMIKNKLVEKQQWKDIALGITTNTEGERVQSSGSQQKMADAICNCVDIDIEINCLIDKLVDKKREVIATIEQLPALEYDVLHKIYVQRMTMYDVASILDKSYSNITTIHGRALHSVQRILDERERETTETCD